LAQGLRMPPSRDSRSKASSRPSARSGSQAGSEASLVPLLKKERVGADDQPLNNIYAEEVMRALKSRGGAVWLREWEAQQAKKREREGFKGAGADEPGSPKLKFVEGMSDQQASLHILDSKKLYKLLGLDELAKKRADEAKDGKVQFAHHPGQLGEEMIPAAVIVKCGDQLMEIAKRNGSDDLTIVDFENAAAACGLPLDKEQLRCAFKNVDTSGSDPEFKRKESYEEWLEQVDKLAKQSRDPKNNKQKQKEALKARNELLMQRTIQPQEWLDLLKKAAIRTFELNIPLDLDPSWATLAKDVCTKKATVAKGDPILALFEDASTDDDKILPGDQIMEVQEKASAHSQGVLIVERPTAAD